MDVVAPGLHKRQRPLKKRSAGQHWISNRVVFA